MNVMEMLFSRLQGDTSPRSGNRGTDSGGAGGFADLFASLTSGEGEAGTTAGRDLPPELRAMLRQSAGDTPVPLADESASQLSPQGGGRIAAAGLQQLLVALQLGGRQGAGEGQPAQQTEEVPTEAESAGDSESTRGDTAEGADPRGNPTEAAEPQVVRDGGEAFIGRPVRDGRPGFG
ncbi:MAG: hypothetical protein K9L28_10860, partial [Synergistales bacterium]|nr:hypothetical protein [Synergistales bacterium]